MVKYGQYGENTEDVIATGRYSLEGVIDWECSACYDHFKTLENPDGVDQPKECPRCGISFDDWESY